MVGGIALIGWYAITQTDILTVLKGGKLAPVSSPVVTPSTTKTTPTKTTTTTTADDEGSDVGTPAVTKTTATSGDCGTTIYKATGRKGNLTDTGPQGQQIHYASSGKAASSRRLNANNVPFNSIEATIYFQFNGTSCGKPDPEMSIKLWGPTHSNGNCCWCIGVITASGKVCFGGEGPHPSTTTCQQTAGNVGSLTGKIIGMKYIIWPGTGGAHQELYLDTGGGQWKLMGTRDSSCGKDKKSTTVSANQQVEFRIDCKNVTIKCSSVNEITPTKALKANFAYDGKFHYLEHSPVSDLHFHNKPICI